MSNRAIMKRNITQLAISLLLPAAYIADYMLAPFKDILSFFKKNKDTKNIAGSDDGDDFTRRRKRSSEISSEISSKISSGITAYSSPLAYTSSPFANKFTPIIADLNTQNLNPDEKIQSLTRLKNDIAKELSLLEEDYINNGTIFTQFKIGGKVAVILKKTTDGILPEITEHGRNSATCFTICLPHYISKNGKLTQSPDAGMDIFQIDKNGTTIAFCDSGNSENSVLSDNFQKCVKQNESTQWRDAVSTQRNQERKEVSLMDI